MSVVPLRCPSISSGSSATETVHAIPVGLSQFRRLLRKLDVRYHDSLSGAEDSVKAFTQDILPTSDISVAPLVPSRVSVRKVNTTRCISSATSVARMNLSHIYLEVCVMSNPALTGHPNLPQLLGVTVIPPVGDSGDYQFGILTNTIHGTLEDLLAVERKTSRDPRSYLIPWTEREEIAAQCAEGLAALHDCDILHNDVQPASFSVYITQTSPSTRVINVKLNNFAEAMPLTPFTNLDNIPPANGQWCSIGPLANCNASPFCRDIHSFGLMVMYLSYYEFMSMEQTMEFLRTQKSFYDELEMHPALNTSLSLFNVVSKCCVNHGQQILSMHWVAPTIRPGYQSIVIQNGGDWLPVLLVDYSPTSTTDLRDEFNYLRTQALEQPLFNQILFQETLQAVQQTSNSTDALYLSLCYSYGIGTLRDEYLALRWCLTAADGGSIAAKSTTKMLHDAYLRNNLVEDDEFSQRLQSMGKNLEKDLVEALHWSQQTNFNLTNEDMTRMSWNLSKSYPFVYSHEIYPTLRWPLVDKLLRVFMEEHNMLQSPDRMDKQMYQNTFRFMLQMQLDFPLADGSTILHCLAHVVSPNKTRLPLLASIAISTGSNIAAVRNDGRTAADLAVQFGNTSLVAAFLENYGSLGYTVDFIRPMVAISVEWHHYDVLEALARLVPYDGQYQTVPVAATLLSEAFKRSKFERMLVRGRSTSADAQRILDTLVGFGGPNILSVENPHFVEAVKEAVRGGNDDMLSYNRWTIIRALPGEALYEIMELAIKLGELTLLKNIIRLSKLDHSSATKLLKIAIQYSLNSSKMQMIEVILECYQIPEEEYIVDLIQQGSLAAEMVTKIICRNPHILLLHFGPEEQTLLHHAVGNGNLAISKLLFSLGANVNIPDKNGNTPLHLAISHEHRDCVAWLGSLHSITNLEHRNKIGQTPLLYTVHCGKLCGTRSLLNRGADITATTDEGFTALHLAYARYSSRTFLRLSLSMSYLEAQLEQRRAGEVLTGTIAALKEFGIDVEAIDFVMGFNAKSYFSWLMETMAEDGQSGIF